MYTQINERVSHICLNTEHYCSYFADPEFQSHSTAMCTKIVLLFLDPQLYLKIPHPLKNHPLSQYHLT